MKKINDYRKLLGVTENAELKDLKTIYRNLMKDWHPDKFVDSPDDQAGAEEKSKLIIEAYHFLVSIAPETRLANIEAYTLTTAAVGIEGFEFKSQVLQINFLDGSSYEYFGVPKALYIKFVNAPAPGRFARRHIYNSFVYRSFNKQAKAEADGGVAVRHYLLKMSQHVTTCDRLEYFIIASTHSTLSGLALTSCLPWVSPTAIHISALRATHFEVQNMVLTRAYFWHGKS